MTCLKEEFISGILLKSIKFGNFDWLLLDMRTYKQRDMKKIKIKK